MYEHSQHFTSHTCTGHCDRWTRLSQKDRPTHMPLQSSDKLYEQQTTRMSCSELVVLTVGAT